jgi:hypothetical protein
MQHRIFFRHFISIKRSTFFIFRKGVIYLGKFLFFIQFWYWFFFHVNWLGHNLSLICQWISSISYDFRDKPKGNNKGWISKFELILHPILMQFLCKIIIFMGYWWTIQKKFFLILKRGSVHHVLLWVALYNKYISKRVGTGIF